MPITPFHFGPGILIKSFRTRTFSWSMFVLANVAIDVEPVLWFLFTGDPVHDVLHTYLGAFFLALACAYWGKHWCESFLRWWNSSLSERQFEWMGVDEHISQKSAYVSAITSTVSHVFLDSFMHVDVRPYWPFTSANTFQGLLPIEFLHILCIGTGLWGLLLLMTVKWDAIFDKRPPDFNTKTRHSFMQIGQMFVRIFLRIASISVGFITIGMMLIMPFQVSDDNDKRRDAFSSQVWKKAEDLKYSADSPRYFMLHSLTAQLERDQPSRTEVITLLGNPVGHAADHEAFMYWVGRPTYGITPAELYVYFDPSGRYESFKIHSD